jgi:high-affinity iron transporter
MFSAAIIVFRETLEAALIIGLLAASTRGIPHRHLWLWSGLLLGLAGSVAVAASIDAIANFASGIGQELFNTGVLGVAVLMLAWHNVWMASHGTALTSQARDVGGAVRDGRSTCSILLVVVGLAVLREGSETVLFLYGIAASGREGLLAMLGGGLLGMAAGTAVGGALYLGLLRIPLRWFFGATAALVLFLAAGMASQAARFLIQADVVPSLAAPLWDTSAFLSERSPGGALLHSLVGYDAQPAGMQLVFYIATLLIIGAGMQLAHRRTSH